MNNLILPSLVLTTYFLNKHKDSIKIARKKWKRLINLIGTTEKNKIKIYMIGVKMTAHLAIDKVCEYFERTNTKKINNNLYEVSYKIESKRYKMLIEPSKGPAPVLQITNNLEDDVTDMVLSYMGPKYDWHSFYESNNTKFNPSDFFSYDWLSFELSDGDTQFIYATGKEPSKKED
jgi:hypothetical protein